MHLNSIYVVTIIGVESLNSLINFLGALSAHYYKEAQSSGYSQDPSSYNTSE